MTDEKNRKEKKITLTWRTGFYRGSLGARSHQPTIEKKKECSKEKKDSSN